MLADAKGGRPSVILIGTGSEVALCVDAHDELAREGIAARVVSMPSWELFEQQDQAYRDSLLPPEVTARVLVEQASVIGWDRYVRMNGASAPLKDLLTKFGFTLDTVIAAAKDQIAKSQRLNS
jgi:transketolase